MPEIGTKPSDTKRMGPVLIYIVHDLIVLVPSVRRPNYYYDVSFCMEFSWQVTNSDPAVIEKLIVVSLTDQCK